jgi:hypothetical protein
MFIILKILEHKILGKHSKQYRKWAQCLFEEKTWVIIY